MAPDPVDSASGRPDVSRSLSERLGEIVGSSHVLTDADAMAGYLTDWTGRWTGSAVAVVRPLTADEVAAVVGLCADEGIAICPQGGNTGLVGGSIPPADASTPAIVLSTARMTDIDEIDTVGRSVGVQAGVTLAALDARASSAGLRFGVDLASRESATLGGMVATNAGGTRMIRHGNTRSQLLGIEAVRADGQILRRWRSLVKDNVGYDVPGLLAGSEGTLAVITRVLVRLVPTTGATVVFVAAIDDVSVALALIDAVSDAGLTTEAAEIMTQAGVDLVHDHGVRRPVSSPAQFYVLLEVSGPHDAEDVVLQVLDGQPGVVDAVVEPGPARDLWLVRESHTESIARSTTTPVVKLDVSVPLRALPAAFAELAAIADDDDCRPILFGHVGDGNIHVNLLDVAEESVESLTDRVFRVVSAHGGSISAEHGIGRAKVAWTGLGRSAVDLDTMKAIKTALDPAGLLNPGVLFE
ncbi:FAD-linked oxidase [Gordonia sp. 852002-50816_SCH5313054-c]|uniref:FAD-linked oxidase n=1 Tax=Gordonia jacobaea TaxID=122202 RepID=A0ABR5IDC5_9ACTN|nr:FAD-linked oxidase [Gordonia jacobaea]OBC03948.1 FAD-linked oxidase [Gordonia sp. 852002-50816_SCH5313054-a]OBC14386.1 FAD-linked oxidase [Gordonia sp. 852002-50816_SCH5313054-c]